MKLSGSAAAAETLLDSFELWLGERPKWLQTAARQLFDGKRLPDEKQILSLATMCKAEASGVGGVVFSELQPGSLSASVTRPYIRIDGLTDVHGVNAIKDGAALSFGSGNMAVIYGANGVGKTGFSRVLKHACGSRAKDDLHSNVFETSSVPTAAKIQMSVAGAPQTIDWNLGGSALKQLRNVHVFDSKSAGMYVGLPNEAAYEPRRMRFLSSLVSICDGVAACLDSEKKSLIKKLATLPPEFATTSASKWLGSLRATTSAVDIDKGCDYPKNLDDERIAMESALAEKDVVGRLKTIVVERAALAKLKANCAALRIGLGDAAIESLVAARHEAKIKREIAAGGAKQAFGAAPLDGVGQATWMSLWEHARKYSESHAYLGKHFPVIESGSLCVLCQQTIAEEGASRLSHFEQFVKGGLEADAKAAESKFGDLSKKLPVLPQLNDWIVQVSILKIGEELAKAGFEALQARRAAGDMAVQLQDVPAFDWVPFEMAITNAEQLQVAEEKSLNDLQQDGMRKQLEARVVDLRSVQWLSQNKQAIVEEVSRLAAVGVLDRASSLTKTNALTAKKNELAKQELDAGYQARFAKELELLGGKRIPVRPLSKQEGKAKISFVLALKGAKKAIDARYVLSEGEARVVALAAFLADITGADHAAPFIFDDPISSLDQGFEERVVARLVDLSKTRQVVVFTHRLSLLSLIESAVDRLEDQAKLQKIAAPVSLHVETLYRLGNAAGIVHQLSLRETKPQKAVNRLLKESVPQLRKLFEQGDIAAYEARARSICTDLRILMERSVEKVLLNDVLQRFRRSVETKGKIGALAKIKPEDCAMVDDLMTRYSAFEHSQPDELPAELPDIDVLQNDVSTLAAWMAEFDKRGTGQG